MSIYDENSANNNEHKGQNYSQLLGQLETNLETNNSLDHSSLNLDNAVSFNKASANSFAQAHISAIKQDESLQAHTNDSTKDSQANELFLDESSDFDEQNYLAKSNDNSERAKGTTRLVRPGALVVFLLKGYIDREDNKVLFDALIRQEREVEEFCRRLFLRLVIDQEAGYAYVRSLTEEELPSDAGQRPPQLLIKRPMPFYESFILILLRQRLLEFDMSGQFGRLVLERAEIISLVKTFVHNVNNEKRLDDNLNKAIDNLCSLGLLGKNSSGASLKKENRDLDRIEVRRIISVIVTPEILKQSDEILESYVKHVKEGGRAKNRLTEDDNISFD